MFVPTAPIPVSKHQRCCKQARPNRAEPRRPASNSSPGKNALLQHASKQETLFTPDAFLLQYAPPNIKIQHLDARKLLSRAMLQTQSLEELQDLLELHQQHFNSQNFTILLTKLQHLQSSQPSSLDATTICRKATKLLRLKVLECDAQCIITAIHTIAKLWMHERHALDDLLFACMDLWDTMTPMSFSKLIYSLGLLQHRPLDRQFVFQYFKHAQEQLPCFDAQAISTCMYGLARLSLVPPEDFTRALWQQADCQLPEFTDQGLCMLMWSCAKLKLKPPQHLLTKLVQQTGKQLPNYTPQGVSLAMWCMVKLGCKPSAEWWASAEAEYLHRFEQGIPRNLTMATYAMWKAGHQPSPAWSKQMFGYASTHLHRFDPHALVMLIYCSAKLQLQPPAEFMKCYLAAVCSRYDTFGPQSFALTIWSLAKLKYMPSSSWLQLFAAHSQPILRFMNSQELSLSIYSLASLGMYPGRAWLAAFSSASEPKLAGGEFRTSHLGKTLHSFAILQYQPGQSWWAAYSHQLKEQMHSIPAYTLLDIIWAAGQLGLELPSELEGGMFAIAVC